MTFSWRTSGIDAILPRTCPMGVFFMLSSISSMSMSSFALISIAVSSRLLGSVSNLLLFNSNLSIFIVIPILLIICLTILLSTCFLKPQYIVCYICVSKLSNAIYSIIIVCGLRKALIIPAIF